MAKSANLNTQSTKKNKVGFQHNLLFIAVAAALFFYFMYSLIPAGVSGFVVPLFKPSGDKLQKIGFVEFKGGVWASTSKDKEAQFKGKNLEIKKDYINKEYIFDFTYTARNTAQHGYTKGANEYYAKAEALGENAIILEPWLGFSIIAFVLSIVLTMFLTMILPTGMGLMAVLFDRQIDGTRVKIRLQTGFTDDIVNILIMPDVKLVDFDHDDAERMFRIIWERTRTDDLSSTKSLLRFDDIFDDNTDLVLFRNDAIYERIKEYFSDFVVKEIEDTKDGLVWRANHLLFGKGLRLYMSHHFTEKYSNNVTGMAYGGAAFLIVAVGVRGLKFIPAAKPSFIMLAIFLEFSMLALLAVTLFYTEEEERMDKMLKKMEDANRSQLETLKGQQHDIHQLTNALVGQTAEIIKGRVETAISGYMTSDKAMESAIASEIGSKIMEGIRDAYSAGDKK
jgi:hypothetical protein